MSSETSSPKEPMSQSEMGGRERTAQKAQMKAKYQQPWDLVCDQESLKNQSLQCLTTVGNTKEDCQKQIDAYKACLQAIRDAKTAERNRRFFELPGSEKKN